MRLNRFALGIFAFAFGFGFGFGFGKMFFSQTENQREPQSRRSNLEWGLRKMISHKQNREPARAAGAILEWGILESVWNSPNRVRLSLVQLEKEPKNHSHLGIRVNAIGVL